MSVLWAVLSAVLPLVDPAAHEIRDACRLEAVAFRTEQDGWVTTGCGQVYRTRDGGSAEEQIFVSDDRETWFAVSEAPAGPRRLTVVGKETKVLESDVGVFRSESGGRDWQKSTQPELDVADADRARGIREAKNPLACVATARMAELKVELGSQGCFGGSSTHGSITSVGGLVCEGERRRDPASLRTLVDALGEAVLRVEDPSG
jgi:hypothetical protein